MTTEQSAKIVKGRLILGDIRDEQIRHKVLRYLQNVFPKAPSEKLAEFTNQADASIPVTSGETQIRQILRNLRKIGSPARFVTEPSAADKLGVEKPIDYNRIRGLLIRGFTGKIDRIPLSLFYRAGLAVNAFIMVLLPLIYLGLIACVIYLLQWHIRENVSFFHTINSGKGAFLSYVGPIIIGVLLLLFMIKPLFARQKDSFVRKKLDPKKEAFLYAFVKKVAVTLGAPEPATIYTVMDVNAFANLKPGLKGFMTRELELSIGLPLAAGTNLHQLTEVIGHELGHFAQNAGMRLTYVIRTINYWFSKVVYLRDEWDERIKSWGDVYYQLAIILFVARFFIWFTRKILWVLMWTGEVVSSFMLRQMEFDADRHGLALIGADVFQSSSDRLIILSSAHGWAENDLSSAWQEGRLADNLPALIKTRAGQIPEADKKKILHKAIQETKRKLFDTHPTFAERIAHARKHEQALCFKPDMSDPEMRRLQAKEKKVDSDGVCANSLSAAILFTDFNALSKDRTHHYYETILGEAVPRDRLVPYENLIKSQEKETQAFEALDHVFLKQFNVDHNPRLFPWPIPSMGEPESIIQKLQADTLELKEKKKAYEKSLEQYTKQEDRLIELDQAKTLADAGLSFRPKDFNLKSKNQAVLQQIIERTGQEQLKTEERLAPFELVACRRIETLLSCMISPELSGKINGLGQMKKRTAKCIQAWNELAPRFDFYKKIKYTYYQLVLLAHQIEHNEDNKKFIQDLQLRMKAAVALLKNLNVRLANVDYPFDHADSRMTLGNFIVGRIPPEDQLGEIIEILDGAAQRTFQLYHRLMAHLCEICLKIENSIHKMN